MTGEASSVDKIPDFVAGLRPQQKGAIAAFDADGTLWRGDIFEDFCAWLVAEGELVQSDIDGYESLLTEDELAAIYKMMGFFKGFDEGRFNKLVSRFFAEHGPIWHPDVKSTLIYLAEQGFEVVILSASARLLLEPAFVELPVAKIIAMEFVSDERGVFTGETPSPSPAGQGKALLIHDEYGGLLEFAAGNSKLDADFMKLATQGAWAYGPDAELAQIAQNLGWYST